MLRKNYFHSLRLLIQAMLRYNSTKSIMCWERSCWSTRCVPHVSPRPSSLCRARRPIAKTPGSPKRFLNPDLPAKESPMTLVYTHSSHTHTHHSRTPTHSYTTVGPHPLTQKTFLNPDLPAKAPPKTLVYTHSAHAHHSGTPTHSHKTPLTATTHSEFRLINLRKLLLLRAADESKSPDAPLPPTPPPPS